jgi:hypothetical protein
MGINRRGGNLNNVAEYADMKTLTNGSRVRTCRTMVYRGEFGSRQGVFQIPCATNSGGRARAKLMESLVNQGLGC